jgi:hypothetical protein
MKKAKRVALYFCGALIVFVWATIVDGLAVFGSPAYFVGYRAARLCNSLRPGMELRDAEARMLRLGRPASIEYRSGQLDVAGTDSNCILDIDPTTNRIVKITISGAMSVE